MPRWISWFWGRPGRVPNYSACRTCGKPLALCGVCHGDWRRDACRACQLGLQCPSLDHANNWI
jgi:hypothetical protein